MHRLVRQSFRPKESMVSSSRPLLEGFDFYSISIGIDVTKQSDYARDRSSAKKTTAKNNKGRTTTARHDHEEVMATFLNSVVKEPLQVATRGPGDLLDTRARQGKTLQMLGCGSLCHSALITTCYIVPSLYCSPSFHFRPPPSTSDSPSWTIHASVRGLLCPS